MNITNKHGIPLSLAVWLMKDDYDYDPTAISATSLLRPIRQAILSSRMPRQQITMDLSDLIASRMGTSLHAGVEDAWKSKPEVLQAILQQLQIPEKVAKRVIINPTDDELEKGCLPIYMEQRRYATVNGQKISGKYDFLCDGVLEDFKSTSVYSYLLGDKTEKFRQQGSIYRFIDPKRITEDYMRVSYIFTDWQRSQVNVQANYPSSRIKAVEIPLMPIPETKDFIADKLNQFNKFKNVPEESLPRCTDAELWRKPSVFKYYSNPAKTDRSTKNFTNAIDAYAYKSSKGGKGIVIEVKGKVVACQYCRGAAICSQKNEYILEGTLTLGDE